MNKKENTKPTKVELNGVHKVVPIILGAIAIFIAVCLFLDMGSLGHGMRLILRGLFSWGAAMIPVALLVGAFCYKDDVTNGKKAGRRVAFAIVAVILASCIDYAIFSWGADPVFAPIDGFKNMNYGGIVGGTVGYALSSLFGNIGSIILCCAVLLIYAVFFFAEKAGALGRAAIKVAEFFKKAIGLAKDKNKAYKEKKQQIKEDAEQHRREVSSEELIDDEFFKAKGEAADIKIKQLGIDENADTHGLSPLVEPEKRIVEEPVAAPAEVEHKRKRSEKPLDLSYGIEEPEEEEPVEEEPKKEEKSKFDFGLDDTADNVFTKDFDPFDFATSEKASAKYASKVGAHSAVTEELDELTLYEMKANHVPSEREKRMMDLERKKQEWLRTHPKSQPAPSPAVSQAVPEEIKPVNSAPEASEAPKAETVSMAAGVPASTPVNTSVSTPVGTPVNTPVRVPAASSYPKTSYTQPIKTVEFTISKGPQPPMDKPIESGEITMTVDKAQKPDEAEDIAILISQRIAQSNPAYARSANDLKTYTKVVSDGDDELYRQLQGISAPEAEEKTEPAQTTYSATTDASVNGVRDTVYEDDNEDELVLSDNVQDVANAVSGVTDAQVNHSESISAEAVTPSENLNAAPSQSVNAAPAQEDVVTQTELPAPQVSFEEETSIQSVEAKTPAAESKEALPESVEFSVGKTESEAKEPTIQSTYQRAAGFASALVNEAAPAPEFKPYIPPVIPVVPSISESVEEEPTLKVERSMLPPTPEAIYAESEANGTVVTGSVSAPQSEETDAIHQNSTPSVSFAPATNAQSTDNTQNTGGQSKGSDSHGIEESISFIPEGDSVPESVENATSENQAVDTDTEVDFAPADEMEKKAKDTASDSLDIPDFTQVDGEENEQSEEDETYDSVDFDEDEDEEETEPEEDGEMDEIPPEEQNPEVARMRGMFTVLDPIETETPTQAPTSMPAADSKAEIVISEIEEDISDVPFDEPVQVKAPSTSLVPANEKKAKKEKSKPDYSGYEFPPLDFLSKQESSHDDNIQAEIQENADKLIETLASFGVTASIKGVDRGPRITRYEVVPAKGVKVSSILNLQDDIALNLAAGSIRMEAPIPGKSAVGIEIPNKKSSIVRLRDLLETPDFVSEKSKTFVCIGRDVAGQPVFGDLAKMPHLLIAGATGMGKSVCINSLLISVLYKARPDEVKFIMIDPKQVEFTMYNGIPHLLVPVVSDPKQAAGALMWAVDEMERRYNLLNPLCVRNIDAYNEKVSQDPSLGEKLPKIIIVIDEFADLMLQVKDPVEALVTRIAQKARAAGIHLVIGTQRPSVNVITGVIKANVPSRISCKVMSNVDSKTVLDSAGAEKLLDRGDALYAPSGSPKPHRLQCAFVADGEVETVMNYLKQFSTGDSYDSSVMEDIERAAQKCNKKGGGADRDDSDSSDGSGEGYLNDRQFLDAVEIAVNTRKISTSLIQRKLSIGYGKAAKFIDIMEDMGIVGEANGQRPREVMLTPDEWREKLARASLD